MPIQTGQQAPDFTLRDTGKNKVTLSEQKGKNVVLLFFPLAFTGVCTKELCSVRDNLEMYNRLNATVYGISVDSLQSLNRFKADRDLNFDLLVADKVSDILPMLEAAIAPVPEERKQMTPATAGKL